MGAYLSWPMKVCLLETDKHGDPMSSAHGMSQRGGRAQSVEAVIKRGLLTRRFEKVDPPEDDGAGGRIIGRWIYELTEAGRLMVDSLKVKGRR